ncbi:UDP-2,4-diacetamido-2,4,6-trideoxy-beta-L-altropy ranose hydrolase [Microbulbifer sp. GL-2]|nr:UDP-2,4-diacetamido-2,4,6-trideoxy-beta-L-altropy ranose hydrolase [Microbulbifer sp. GL-2]
MRCLTLAEELKKNGASCHFICREHTGNLFGLIKDRGFELTPLHFEVPNKSISSKEHSDTLKYASWSGVDWKLDAEQTVAAISNFEPDWLVVDHYGLDRAWETYVKSYTRYFMVIDDLADRFHTCDLLLDQNLGRVVSDYSALTPKQNVSLIGPKYALLRPEFAALREYSLNRRSYSQLKSIMISMGGVDNYNASGQVLKSLESSNLPLDCQVSIVLGQHSPWLQNVRQAAKKSKLQVNVFCDVKDMARKLADCDLAIGAGGITSWERACLGVPSFIVVLADNQRLGASALHNLGAAKIIGQINDIQIQLPLRISEVIGSSLLETMSNSTAEITDGLGASRVVEVMRRVISS